MDTPPTHPISPGYQSSDELLRDSSETETESAELSGVRVAKRKNKSKMKELISLGFSYGGGKASSKREKRQLPTFHFFQERPTVQSQVNQHRPGGLTIEEASKKLQH